MASGEMARNIVGGSVVLGLFVGFLVESNTNEVASVKAEAAEVCLRELGEHSLIGTVGVDCLDREMREGGEDWIDREKIDENTTKEELREYMVDQQVEAANHEASRYVGWGFAGASEVLTITLAYQALVD